MDFRFVARRPAGLERYVESVWFARGRIDYPDERIAPTGSTVAVVVLGDPIRETPADGAGEPLVTATGFLLGPHDRPVVNEPLGETFCVGIVTTPVGCEAVFGVRPATIRGRVVELASAWPAAAPLRRRLLDLHARPGAPADESTGGHGDSSGDGGSADGRNGGNTDGRDGGNTDDRDGRNTDDRDGRNTDDRDGRNTDSRDGRNTDSRDGRNTDDRDGRNTDSRDGRNTDSRDGRNTDSRDGANTDSRDGRNTDSRDGANTDSRDGANTDDRNSANTDSRNGRPADGRNGGSADDLLDLVGATVEAGLQPRETRRCERAVAALEADPARSIGALAAELGVSHGHLDREFTEVVGLSPRALARILRLRVLLARLDVYAPVPWSALAAELGWFDQSHFIRDFKRHTGVTPSEYVAAQRGSFTPDQAAPGFVPRR